MEEVIRILFLMVLACTIIPLGLIATNRYDGEKLTTSEKKDCYILLAVSIISFIILMVVGV